MFEPSSKKVLLAVLVTCFVIQTGLVYSDERTGPLSDAAVRGRRIFHTEACQVCHQLYGQGGFLGPDLTNAAGRVDDARLVSLLTVGSGQMPPFGLDGAQIADVRAFLEEIDRPDLGYGQLRLGDPDQGEGPQGAFEAAVRGAAPPSAVVTGLEAYSAGMCATCHVPFRTSLVNAPDLSTATRRWDDTALADVLMSGRPERGMPPPVPPLTEAQRAGMLAYLHWLDDNRDQLEAETQRILSARTTDWSDLPWWEYR